MPSIVDVGQDNSFNLPARMPSKAGKGLGASRGWRWQLNSDVFIRKSTEIEASRHESFDPPCSGVAKPALGIGKRLPQQGVTGAGLQGQSGRAIPWPF